MGMIWTGLLTVGVFGGSVIGAAFSRLLADDLREWAPHIVEWSNDRAVMRLPEDWRDRMRKEWRGHVYDVPGTSSKLVEALGFQFAARKLSVEIMTRSVEWTSMASPPIKKIVWEIQKSLDELEGPNGGDALNDLSDALARVGIGELVFSGYGDDPPYVRLFNSSALSPAIIAAVGEIINNSVLRLEMDCEHGRRG